METFIATALVGIVVGMLSGLLGIGGGTLMVPIFRLGFGLSAFASTATSLFTIIPTSLVGFVTHIKNKTCIPQVGIAAGLGGAVTSPIGVYLANISPAWLVMLAAAVIIGFSSYKMFKKAARIPKVQAAEGGKVLGVDAQVAAQKAADSQEATGVDSFEFTRKKLFQSVGIGLIAGLASGYVGVGGGFLMVPLFISVLGIMMRHASGTSLVAIMILAIPGVIEQGLLGNIDYMAGIAMAVGSIPGAVIGANLVRRIPERQLRLFFGAFLLVSAVVLLANEFAAM